MNPHVPLPQGNSQLPVFDRRTLAILALLVPGAALGVAYRLPSQDPEAMSRGNAFAATADNPSAIYYNPAGITQLDGQNIQAGFYLVNANITIKPLSGGKVENKFEFQPVPELYYTAKPSKDLPITLGIGVYAPYGLGLEYDNDSSIRTLAVRGKLLYATVNPVIAWKVSDSFSIAVGPTLNYSVVHFRRGIGLGAPGDLFRTEGDAFAPGFSAGAMWQPHEQWSFGVKYHHETALDYSGTSELSPYFAATPTKAEIQFPRFVVGGISYRPTPDWNLEFNADWTDWNSVNQTDFRGTPAAVGPVSFPFHYTSSWMYEFGVSRKLPHDFVVGAGYFFSENSSPDKYFNPIIPDADLHLGSIGFGHKGQRWDWYLAYHFALGGRTVTENINPVGVGRYDLFNQAVALSARFKF